MGERGLIQTAGEEKACLGGRGGGWGGVGGVRAGGGLGGGEEGEQKTISGRLAALGRSEGPKAGEGLRGEEGHFLNARTFSFSFFLSFF